MHARLLALYALSGFAALGVETIWMRWFRELLGATAPAASATLVAFFSGHALGAWWSGRRVARWRRPVAAYGCIELLAAAGALLVPLGLAAGDLWLRTSYDALRESAIALHGARLAFALLATFPASFFFGASFPAIGEAAVGPAGRLGTGGSALYAVNLLGAATGAAATTFFLLGWWGVRATYGVAVTLLVGVGLAAVVLGRRSAERSEPARVGPAARGAPSRPEPADRMPSRRSLAALAMLSGFCAFATQVLAVQALAQVLNGSIFAFGAVTVTVLSSLALGAAIVSIVLRRSSIDPLPLLGVALGGSALLVVSIPAALVAATGGLSYVGGDAPGFPYLWRALGTAAATAGPGLLAGGLVLPLTFALAGSRERATDSGGAGRPLGRLVAANTIGALLGALSTPYLLMPHFGLWGAFLAVGGLYAAAALVLPERASAARQWRRGAVGVGAVVVLGFANPARIASHGAESAERIVFSETTPSGLVEVVDRPDGRVLRIDNHYALGGTGEQVHEERQAHLPLVLAPDARRVAYVGSATGISAGAVLEHGVERLHLVERVPGVVRAARTHFAAANRRVYDAEPTRVVVDDARNFLRSTRERFDLVVADLFVPWREGTGSLYTREHFTAVRDDLLADGVFVQWLALYQLSRAELDVIAATFVDVFPRAALFRGDFYGGFPIAALVGYAGTPASPERVAQAARELGLRGVRDRWVTDPLGVWALYVGPLSPLVPHLAAVPRNSDDSPWIERNAAAGHAGGERGKVDPVVGLDWIRFTDPIVSSVLTDVDPVFGTLSLEEKRAALGGAFLQRAGALWVSGESREAASAFAEAAASLPGRLVADSEPDETAAELWTAE